jgi:hypothetical protein
MNDQKATVKKDSRSFRAENNRSNPSNVHLSKVVRPAVRAEIRALLRHRPRHIEG